MKPSRPLLLAIILLLAACQGSRPEGIWFDDLREPLSLTLADTGDLGRFVAAAVHRPGASLPPLPRVVRQDRAPRIVSLALGDGTHAPRILRGSGLGAEAALEDVLLRTHSIFGNQEPPPWLMLDIVTHVQPMGAVPLARPLDIVPGLNGIAFERGTGVALFPGQLLGNGLLSGRSSLRTDRIGAYWTHHFPEMPRLDLASRTAAPLDAFGTISIFSNAATVIALYRGHGTFKDPDASLLLRAARSAGTYLVNATGDNGQFVYSYQAAFDTVARDYNLLRHAGTAYSMFELYEVTRDPALLEAANRAIRRLLDFVLPCPSDTKQFACVVGGDRIKLGGNALAVIALAKCTKVTGDRQYLPQMRQLAGWIASTQGKDGAFTVHKQRHSTGEIADFVSQYYPGEALLALTRLFVADGDQRWLDVAEKGALYLIQVRDAGLTTRQLSHDHWLLYALRDLYRYRPSPTILDHAMRIAEAIVTGQNRTPRYPDWLGSYYRPPRSTPTAIRSEGLVAAYELARETGRDGMAVRILEAVKLGIAFQLQTQFRPESAFWLPRPERALGGFHASLTDFEIRIDYVQHNISSLLGLARILTEGDSTPQASAQAPPRRER